jgi:5-methylcytosine-specific restriction protein A
MGDKTNHITNGILMRADIHTLFDLGLFAIDSATYKVILASELQGSSYSEFDGRKLKLPKKEAEWPSKDALLTHRGWMTI